MAERKFYSVIFASLVVGLTVMAAATPTFAGQANNQNAANDHCDSGTNPAALLCYFNLQTWEFKKKTFSEERYIQELEQPQGRPGRTPLQPIDHTIQECAGYGDHEE